jgi:hypothetical protein
MEPTSTPTSKPSGRRKERTSESEHEAGNGCRNHGNDGCDGDFPPCRKASAACRRDSQAIEHARRPPSQAKGGSKELSAVRVPLGAVSRIKGKEDMMERELDPFERWMVKSNLATINSGTLMKDRVVILKANGYPKVAAAVEKAWNERKTP